MALESRNAYGWSGQSVGYRSAKELAKWQVAYRTASGGFGIVGWVCLFVRKEDAVAFGEKFKAEHDYVTEIIIQHPSKCYSAY